MRVVTLVALATLLGSPAWAHSAVELHGSKGLRAWGSQVLSAGMQPGVVSKLLAKVESDWMTKATSALRGERENATTLAEVKQSCSKIASSIVQGSSGNKDNVMEYMRDVCASNVAQSTEERGCKQFASALQRLMSDDDSTNRNDLDFPSFCASYYTATVVVDAKAKKEREDKEAAEKKAAEEKAAKEAAEKKAAEEKAEKEAAAKKAAEEKAAKEAAEKKAAEEKAAKEAAEKKAAEEKAEEEVREAEEKAQKAAEIAAEKRKAVAKKKSAAPASPAKEPMAQEQSVSLPAKPEIGEKKQLTLASMRTPKGAKQNHGKLNEMNQKRVAETSTKKLKEGRAKTRKI